MAISTPTLKYLFALSGNVCVFPGCDEPVAEDGPDGNPQIIGEVAHIVGESRQGPRGRAELTDAERNSAANLFIPCPKHHKKIDGDPHTFSVPVLTKIKRDHEARFATRPVAVEPRRPTVTDPVTATVMPLLHVPRCVHAAKTSARSLGEVAARLPGKSQDTAPVTPFLLRDGMLLAFDDLSDSRSPFARSVDRSEPVAVWSAQHMWEDPDSRRHYVALLNKGLRLLLERDYRLVFDHDHRRFYFPHNAGNLEGVTLRTKSGRRMERSVLYERINKRTNATAEWWHEAMQCRFEQFGHLSWGLTLQPAFHLTIDGYQAFPPKLVGRRVTRRKARIFNEQYYDRVHFWREYLTSGSPRFVLRFGAQSVVADAELPTGEITWPDIGDTRFDPAQREPENLISLIEYQQAASGTFDWNDVFVDDEEEPEDEDLYGEHGL